MTDDLELRKLVERARVCEQEALSLIYEKYVDRVYRYVFARVGDREAAQDITGQTFLKLVERIGGFKWRGAGFEAWLFRMARNNVIDWYRRRPSMPEAGPEAAATIAEPTAGPETAVLTGEALREALTAVGDLKGNRRQVVLLRVVAELTTRETASVLEISEANVRTLLHRALATIREKLEEHVHA